MVRILYFKGYSALTYITHPWAASQSSVLFDISFQIAKISQCFALDINLHFNGSWLILLDHRLSETSSVYSIFRYYPGSLSVTRVRWFFCMRDNSWSPFLVLRPQRKKPQLLNRELDPSHLKELAILKTQRKLSKKKYMVWRDRGHIRRLLKYASYDESHRRGIPCSLALRIKKRRGSLQNVTNIYELFRRVLPNDVTLSKSTSFSIAAHWLICVVIWNPLIDNCAGSVTHSWEPAGCD